jgi:hypothetical protein
MKIAVCVSALSVLIAAPALAQTRPPTPSTDELIARHVAARGGAALHNIKTLKMSGTMRPAGFDADLLYEEIMARPGSVRIDATLQGLTIVQAYDGTAGWQIQPFQGRKDPETLSEDDTKSLQEEADFDDGLVDYKAKGSTVDNLGSVDIDGAPTWALRVSLKNGDQETYYLDPDAMLTVRMVTRQIIRGAETITQTDYGDYEKVAGVYFPFEVATGPKGSTQQQRVTYKTIVANGPVPASVFERPVGPSATPAPGAPVPVTPKPEAPVPADPQARAVTPSPEH